MSHTVEAPSSANLSGPTPIAPTQAAFGDISARLAGAGAVTFAVTVLAQNILRGASAPANGASTTEVLTHYVDHRAITFVLIATYVLSGAGLFVFLGGAMRRLLGTTRKGWAYTGFVGAACILALFTVVVAA